MGIELRQSDEWARYLSQIGWEVEEVKSQKEKVKVYVRRIPLLGSVIKIQRPVKIPPIAEIDRLAKKYRSLLVKLEPLTEPDLELSAFNFESDSSPNLPTKTLVNDLTKRESEIWADLSRDARQSIKKAQESNLKVVISNSEKPDFEKNLIKFHQLLAQTGQRQGFWVSSVDQLQNKCQAFGKNAIIFLVYPPSYPAVSRSESSDLRSRPQLPSYPIAGALFLVAGETAFYHHAASSKEGQILFAPYLLLWEALRFFKSPPKTYHLSPITYLDHEGVVDPRFPQTKKWEKFTVFKRKWGGEETIYPPPLVKYYSLPTKILFAVGGLLG